MESPPPSFPSLPPPPTQKTRRKFSATVLISVIVVALFAGCFIGYCVTYTDFNNKLTELQGQLGLVQSASNSSSPTFTFNDNVSLSALYQQVKSSVVIIQDLVPARTFFGGTVYSMQQGSGFITKVNNQLVVVTNNHVVSGSINQTVTLANGDTYPATVLGSDPKADLAVLIMNPMPTGLTPLTLGNSAALQVGDPVVAVGSPYGLSGTLTSGIVSALGRTIVESSDSGRDNTQIPNTIQTSTPINAGNSGGPLITYNGEVVGITTAGISDSEGLGFAIPSETIIRELPTLVSTGSYDQHPSINAEGTDMNYQIAQAMGVSVTYGWLVESASGQNGLVGGDTRATILGSQVTIGGDIIIAINNQRITNTDDLLAYLEQHTLPGQTVNFTVVRDGQTQTISVGIGTAS